MKSKIVPSLILQLLRGKGLLLGVEPAQHHLKTSFANRKSI